MAECALNVKGLGKDYVVRHATARHDSLYEALGAFMKAPLQSLKTMGNGAASAEQFWALRDIDFEVAHGEVLGIVGRNGAGKSTLLKILSRITAPTRGRVEVHGRLASLLEVGTGFHPELSGRENIYLNGAILGMSRADVTRKFDDIVQFAEIEKFIDTPVKRYSSGMYVRLAFGVAAHLDADVLLVDEVLAVGDASFQKRCLGKMRDVAGSGRTVLFVSHNMVAVQALCTRALYLRQGEIVYDGNVDKAIAAHLDDASQAMRQPLAQRTDRTGDARLRFVDYWIENESGERVNSATLGRTNVICLAYQADTELEEVYVAFDIRESIGEAVTNCNTADVGSDFARVPAGAGVFRCTLPRFPVRAGYYTGNLYASAKGTVLDFIQNGLEINIEDGDFYGTGSLRNTCRVMLEQTWHCAPERQPS
jgi:lipopolysaccharide transport system ATP-binding protein